MKIGFDLDGVLCEIDMVALNLMDKLPVNGRVDIESYYYDTVKPLLNPEDFLNDGDIYYVITGRHDQLTATTFRWLNKYCPNYSDYFIVGGKPWYLRDETDHKTFHKSGAEMKADLINTLELDIYIDDSPKVVEILRRLCPNTKVIQYGGRETY